MTTGDLTIIPAARLRGPAAYHVPDRGLNVPA